jgi:hypothetical protein
MFVPWWRRWFRRPSQPIQSRKQPGRLARPQVEELEPRILLSAASNQTVLRWYDDLFQRPAEAPALQFWSGLLDQGVGRGRVALRLVDSPEQQTQAVAGLYGDLLGRPPDPQGLSYALHFLQAGGHLDQLETAILASPEYGQRSGGQPDTFLSSLYHDVLGREIDASGRDAFSQLLQRGASRADVAAAVVTSPESYQRQVQQLYGRYLERSADPAGLQGWTAALAQGAGREGVLAGLLGSPEYFTRVVAPSPSVTKQPALAVPGQGGQVVAATFTATEVSTAYANEFGIFPVEDASGRIGTLYPGDPGYAAAALSESGQRVVFAQRVAPGMATTVNLPGGTFVGLYLAQNATTAQVKSHNPDDQPGRGPIAFFSFASANPDRFDHVWQRGEHQFAFEDLFAGGDLDFNDLELRVDFPVPPPDSGSSDTTAPTITLVSPTRPRVRPTRLLPR